MDVFDLTAKLTLDSSEYDKALGQAETSGASFGQVFGGVMGGIGPPPESQRRLSGPLERQLRRQRMN